MTYKLFLMSTGGFFSGMFIVCFNPAEYGAQNVTHKGVEKAVNMQNKL